MITRDRFADYCRAKNLKTNTKHKYIACLNHWCRLDLGEPTDDAAARYRDTRIGEGASQSTVRYELAKLLSMAKWAGHSIDVRLPREVQRTPEAWTRKQLKALFREARTTQRTIWGIPGRVFWPALLGVCYDTGERIGAVLELRASALDLHQRRVLYAAEIRKGGYRDARANISKSTVRALRSLREVAPSSTLVFRHGCPSGLWKAYGRLLADAGLPTDRRSKFHRLRRTHATFVHAAGGDATAALGHSSPEVTWKHYIDPTALTRRLPWRPWLGW